MKYLSFLLLAILSMVSSKAFAYDIAVKNEDGVTIYYNYINDGNELQVTRSDYQGLVNIPEEVTFENKKRKVTSIGDAAFYSCRRLGSVTIPNSVTIIGNQAFYECRGLSSVTIGNNVITIGLMAFYDCRSLSSIEIPNNVNTIRRSTFYNCYSLTTVTIGNSVNSISDDAFCRCSSLTSIIIPNSVTSIGGSAFWGCSSLTSITIPNSVTSIGGNAFEGCSALTSVVIPNSVTSLGDRAFRNCSCLTSVTIGNSVLFMGESTFYDCSSLTSVISLIENPFKISGKLRDYKTFNLDVFNNAILYVPYGTIDKYKATEGWQDFAHIEEMEATDLAQLQALPVLIQAEDGQFSVEGAPEGTKVAVYDASGVELGAAVSRGGKTLVPARLPQGSIAIVKIGEKSVKVAVK